MFFKFIFGKGYLGISQKVHMSPMGWTWVITLGSKHFSTLSHLTSPGILLPLPPCVTMSTLCHIALVPFLHI